MGGRAKYIQYTNNSLNMVRKYTARIFVRGHYLYWDANSFSIAKLEENCELRGTDNVEGQISEHTLFFFYKNIFYKNTEAEMCEILRMF